MQAVTVKLQFTTPCLGSMRCSDYDKFERDSSGNVIFMASWWHQILAYGSQAFGKHQTLATQVRMHTRIGGEVHRFKRYYAATKYKEHEAFLKGDIITIKAMLPTGLPAEDFRNILQLAGEFEGLSPYGFRDGYGRFEVVDVASQLDALKPQ